MTSGWSFLWRSKVTWGQKNITAWIPGSHGIPRRVRWLNFKIGLWVFHKFWQRITKSVDTLVFFYLQFYKACVLNQFRFHVLKLNVSVSIHSGCFILFVGLISDLYNESDRSHLSLSEFSNFQSCNISLLYAILFDDWIEFGAIKTKKKNIIFFARIVLT